MMKKLICFFLSLIITYNCCYASIFPLYGYKDYKINIKILYSNEINDDSIVQYFKQSMNIGTLLEIQDIKNVANINDIGNSDLIFLDSSINTLTKYESIKKYLEYYVLNGGNLFLSCDFITLVDKKILGIEEFYSITNNSLDLGFCLDDSNTKDIVNVVKDFSDTYLEYGGIEPVFKYGAITNNARKLVYKDDMAYILHNSYGKGTVIWSNNIFPTTSYNIDYNLKESNEKNAFNETYASYNSLFIESIISYVSKNKYGFSLKKTYGPYGRPIISWQNHYEEQNALGNKDMIKWIDFLEKYEQIPTFALIRGSYPWNKWFSTIRVQINKGTNENPIFEGDTADAFYSAGYRLRDSNGNIFFDVCPEIAGLTDKRYVSQTISVSTIDWENDGKTEILVGTAGGEIYLLRSVGNIYEKENITNLFLDNVNQNISVFSYIDNGIQKIAIGNSIGELKIFSKYGDNINLEFQIANLGNNIKPFIYDWNNDGEKDLLLGQENGTIIYYETFANYESNNIAMTDMNGTINVGKNSSPCITDWNGDGIEDLIVGNDNGEILIYTKDKNGNLNYYNKAEVVNGLFWGENILKLGKNSATTILDVNFDGIFDLVTAQIEYGNVTSIDDENFVFKNELQESIDYAIEKYVPVIMHAYTSEYISEPRMKEEAILHKNAMEYYGIDLSEKIGANQHTWRVSKSNPIETLFSFYDVGVKWNFGFNYPNIKTAPRGGKEYLFAKPFYLENEGRRLYVFEPAPDCFLFPNAWNKLANHSMPITIFMHIENRANEETGEFDSLISEIEFINKFREENNYTFGTEEQLAKSIINAVETDVKVKILNDRLLISAKNDNVDDYVGEYKNSLGIEISLGEEYKDKFINTNSDFFWEKDKFFIGINKDCIIDIVEEDKMDNKIYIYAANSPINISKKENGMEIEFLDNGFHEVKIHSVNALYTKDGNVKISQSDEGYVITYYGEAKNVLLEYY